MELDFCSSSDSQTSQELVSDTLDAAAAAVVELHQRRNSINKITDGGGFFFPLPVVLRCRREKETGVPF